MLVLARSVFASREIHANFPSFSISFIATYSISFCATSSVFYHHYNMFCRGAAAFRQNLSPISKENFKNQLISSSGTFNKQQSGRNSAKYCQFGSSISPISKSSQLGFAFGALAVVGGYLWMKDKDAEAEEGPFKLAPLPYPKNALEPFISAETLEYHYEKHHRGYVTKLNKLVEGDKIRSKMTVEELVRREDSKTFNMAAQAFNHEFYWNSMSPHGGGVPAGSLEHAIQESFGSFDIFKAKFNELGVNHFGSGWVWLAKDNNGKLELFSTHDAGNPFANSMKPILCCDVWEHAYYIDYRNDKAKYMNQWWNVVNWKTAEERYRA